MLRFTAVAVVALALLAGGVDARRHQPHGGMNKRGLQAGYGPLLDEQKHAQQTFDNFEPAPSAAFIVPEVNETAVFSPEDAPPAAEAYIFQSSAVPQGAMIDGLDAANGWTLYKQCGQSWSNDMLGTAAGVTICRAGCAMSSVAMIMRTRGANVNPGTFNSWLRNNGGYVSGNLLVWSASDKLGVAKMTNYYHGRGSMSQATLQAAIKSGRGIVVNVRNGGHWVLVTGHAGGSTYTVNDPGYALNTYSYGDMSNFVVYA